MTNYTEDDRLHARRQRAKRLQLREKISTLQATIQRTYCDSAHILTDNQVDYLTRVVSEADDKIKKVKVDAGESEEDEE